MKPQRGFSELKDGQKRRRLEALIPLTENEVGPAAFVENSESHVGNSGCQENIDHCDTSSFSRFSVTHCDQNNASDSESNVSKFDNSSTELESECAIPCSTQTGKCENSCSRKLERCLQEWAIREESISNDCINRLLEKLHKNFPELPKTGERLKKMSSPFPSCSPSRSRSEYTLTDVMDMLHKIMSKQSKLDEIDHLRRGIKRISDQQETLEKLLHEKFRTMEFRSASLEQKLEYTENAPPVCVENSLPGPAKTMEELDFLLKQPALPIALVGLVRVSVAESMRRILKRLLSRELAMQFSFSGLGHRRQQSKISFKDHSAMRTIYEVLAAGGFYDQTEIALATQRGLRGAVDWNGNRSHHRTAAAEAAALASAAASAPTGPPDAAPGPSMSYASDVSLASYMMAGADVPKPEMV